MRKHERDTVRRVLEAALKNLSGDALDGEASSESISLFGDPRSSSESRDSEVPVVLIITGDLRARSQNTAVAKPPSVDDKKEPATVNSCVSDHSERKLSHPGLERFIMPEADSAPPAPRACFMEPGRACVNSGACEMRGF
jgi:hypothetical protein